MVGSGTPRATGSELKLAPRRPNRRNPLENQGFNAKSRERSLSAFCVNWLVSSQKFQLPEPNSPRTKPRLSRFGMRKTQEKRAFQFSLVDRAQWPFPLVICRLEQSC